MERAPDFEKEGKPRGLVKRNGCWHIDKRIGKVRVCRSTGTDDLTIATDILNAEINIFKRKASNEQWERLVAEMRKDKASWINCTFRKMRNRGIQSGKGFRMSMDEFCAIVAGSNGQCEVTGIRFSDHKPQGAKAAPFGISIDRIDASKGYYPENCRVVCLAVNSAMREWGVDVLVRIGKAMLLKELQASIEDEAM